MSILFPEISVLMPTLNCRYLIESQEEAIRSLCGAVGQIVIVDSFSEDGTVEFLESILDGLPVRVIRRPRGLYASWNTGIANCDGEWIHVATAGDLIDGRELRYLLEIAKSRGTDVVAGTPRFVSTGREGIDDRQWPIVDLFKRRAGEEVIEMSGTELVAFSLVHCRPDRQTHSWLGSSASNLYKTSCLKSLPFPTSVGPSGDVLWALMNSATVSATFCGRRCGRFVVHESDSSGPSVRDADVSSVYTKAWVEARDWLLQNLDGVGSGVEVRHLFEKMLDDQITLAEKIVRLRRRRKELADLKAYLHEVRERIPRRLRRFVFPASATRVQSVKPE